MPADFSVDGLPIPRPRSPRFFAPRTDVGFYDGIADDVLTQDDAASQDVAIAKLSGARLQPPSVAARARATTLPSAPLCDPYDVSLGETSSGDTLDDGMPMEMSMSPAALFLSAFSPPIARATPKEERVSASIIDGYTLGPVIGRGGFSAVHRATAPSGDFVAVKIVLHSAVPDSTARQRLANEAAVWAALSHEHILPLFHTAHTPTADCFFMPLCPAGTLFDILQRDGTPGLPHDDAGTMFRQVVRGVRYLHEQAALVHGDLKLENVLVDASGSCRIADFGMARPISHDAAPVRRQRSLLVPSANQRGHAIPSPASRFRAHYSGARHRVSSPFPAANANVAVKALQAVYELPQGSLPYASPELLRVPSADAPYVPDPAQDVWALGVMLHALLTGRLPFWDSFEPRLTMKILKGFDNMPVDLGRGAELVLRGCLTFDAPRRWTIAAVDEIAWAVGWGADALVADDIERLIAESLAPSSSSPADRSRSRSRQPDVIYEDEDDADECAPAPRTHSNDRRAVPPLVSRSSSASTSSLSPSSRGRLSRSRSRSRSASVSVPPSTPIDAHLEDRYAPFAMPHSPASTSFGMPHSPASPLRHSSVSPMRDLSRGRKTRARSNERPAPYRRTSQDPPYSPSPGPSPLAHVHARERSLSPLQLRRAGSQPPANSAPWTVVSKGGGGGAGGAGIGGVIRLPRTSAATVGVSPALSVAQMTPSATAAGEARFVLGFSRGRVGRRSLSVDMHR